MIREIEAKTLLSHHRTADAWFGIRYGMNIYRGCQHGCIYCDSRSECYGIEAFDAEVLVKVNAVERLADELPRKRVKGIIGTGAMSDPYTYAEADYRLTRGALEVIARLGFPLHLMTKSDMVLRDLDILAEIARVRCAVSFTLTTVDDALAAIVEPGAPSPSRRLAAMAALAARGVETGVSMMPILPFLEDSEENITRIVRRAAQAGAHYVIPAFGMTLRTGQREHYYHQLDAHFPGLSQRYQATYGERYDCPVPNAQRLEAVFRGLVRELGLATVVAPYAPEPPAAQLRLL